MTVLFVSVVLRGAFSGEPWVRCVCDVGACGICTAEIEKRQERRGAEGEHRFV